jgi:hypothetical protein
MSPLTIKAQSLKFQSQTPWSIARRPENPRKPQEGHLEEEKPQKPTTGMKSGKAKQNGKRAKKSSEEEETLKIKTEAQKSMKSSKTTSPLKSTPPNPLNAISPP